MSEVKISLVIVPESYDYAEDDIVYRLFFQGQLISERSLPSLETNNAVLETFTVSDELQEQHTRFDIFFENLSLKAAMVKKFILNDDLNIDVKSNEMEIGTKFGNFSLEVISNK
jgi:hypothetical protein